MLQRAELIVQIVHPCSPNGSCASGAQTVSSDNESLSMLGWEYNYRLHLLHYHLSSPAASTTSTVQVPVPIACSDQASSFSQPVQIQVDGDNSCIGAPTCANRSHPFP